jgi:hypothetical protein
VNSVREIPLTRGRVALIDASDFERVGHFKWTVGGFNGKCAYAYRKARDVQGTLRTMLLHRLILDAKPGQFVDHINGDTFDNRRSNLRLATRVQNNCNRRAITDSGLIGIYRKNAGWCGRVQLGAIKHQTRTFNCPILAAAARDVLASRLHADFARLNFQWIPVSAGERP